MALPFIYLTDLQQFNSQAIMEIARLLLVSVGWIGGLTAFVWWKDKNTKKLVVSPSN